jgi:tRNA threonylcarbamoyladenosine biosynthesis protein TsaE
MMATVELPDPQATAAFGRQLGERLFAGAVVSLVGPLGAGKTYLCRAIAEGLQVPDPRIVTSPTFVLAQEYEGGRLPVYHLDAYRLRGDAEFAESGAADYFEGTGVCLVEWGDRIPGCLPADHLRIELSATGPNSRRATLAGTGPSHSALLTG